MQEKLSVMIVDDDKNNRSILKRYLSRDEFLVISAMNAHEAFEILDMVVPDAILMDYQMPKLNGLEAVRKIREVNQRTAVIMMTAYSSQEVAIEAIRSQADDFLPKPLNFAEIPNLVRQLVGKRREMFPVADYSKPPIKENLFTHFLLMKESIPIYSLGRWQKHDKPENLHLLTDHNTEDETLISGFISAIGSFSTSIFGENLAEISMGNHQLLLRNSGPFVVCLTVSIDSYRWLLRNGFLDIIDSALNDILSQVCIYLDESFGYKEGTSFIAGYVNSILKQTALRITTMG